jgi:hypothetical protein
LRRAADIAILLTNSKEKALCGVAYFDEIARGITLGVVEVNFYV